MPKKNPEPARVELVLNQPPAPSEETAEIKGLLGDLRDSIADLYRAVTGGKAGDADEAPAMKEPAVAAGESAHRSRERNPHRASTAERPATAGATKTPEKESHVRVVEEDEPEDGGLIEETCPMCGDPYLLMPGVVRFRCPSCDCLLEVDDEPEDLADDAPAAAKDNGGDEKPARPRETNPGRLLGVFGKR